jgi:hypothetical protein
MQAVAGPQELSPIWQYKGFTKTEALVLEFALRLEPQRKGYCFWIDNLSTTQKLLLRLRLIGIGAAGAVRGCSTKREESEMSRTERRKLQAEIAAHRPDDKLDESLEDDQIIGDISLDGDTQVEGLDSQILPFESQDNPPQTRKATSLPNLVQNSPGLKQEVGTTQHYLFLKIRLEIT